MSDMRNWTVYVHILKLDPIKAYVGITGRKPEIRWENGTGYLKQRKFGNAVRKYGFDAFEHFILASNLTKDEACSMEITLIRRMSEEGYSLYNIDLGGNLKRGRKGKHNSIEHNKKIGDANRGKPKSLSDEQRVAAADRCRNRVSGWMSVKGAKSPFTYATTGKHNCKAHEVYVFDLEWKLLNHFDTIQEASNMYNVGSSAISACCRGRLNKTHGYRFSYYKEDSRALLKL